MKKLVTWMALTLFALGVQAQETIKVGVITDKVGPAKPYAEPATEGIVFGANEINRKGGVLGRKVELLIEDDQGRPDISAAMARKLVDAGAVFILSASLTPATQQQQMQTIRDANPDAMFMAGVLTPENVLILRAYRQMGLKFPIHSSYNLSVPQYMSVAKGLLNGITFVDAYDPQKPQVKEFEAAYKKATGKDPYNLHGYGYDGIMLVADAIRRAGAADKEKIRAAMQKTNYEGVMGAQGMKYVFPEGKRTGYDPNGMVVRVYEGDKQGRVVHVGQK